MLGLIIYSKSKLAYYESMGYSIKKKHLKSYFILSLKCTDESYTERAQLCINKVYAVNFGFMQNLNRYCHQDCRHRTVYT